MFNKELLENFLLTVRKYMGIRGGLSQKDLADSTQTGISTMSRFLNQKTKEIDEQLIAKIVAALAIPLHEIIDFIAEGNEDHFKRMVAVYKESAQDSDNNTRDTRSGETSGMGDFEQALGSGKRETRATVKVGGRSTSIPFGGEQKDSSIREKLMELSPRQKAYLTDFLDLDSEGRDLIVDVGNSLFRYFKQRGLQF